MYINEIDLEWVIRGSGVKLTFIMQEVDLVNIHNWKGHSVFILSFDVFSDNTKKWVSIKWRIQCLTCIEHEFY